MDKQTASTAHSPDATITLTKHQLHGHIDHIFFENVKSLSLGISLLFFIFTAGNLITGAYHEKPLMLAATAGTFIITSTILWLLIKTKMPHSVAHPLAALLMGLMLVNSIFHASYANEPLYLVNLFFVILGAGVFFLSFRWYYITLMVSLVAYAVCYYMFDLTAYAKTMNVALGLMMAISVLINYIRITSNRKFHRLFLISEIQKHHFKDLLEIVQESETKYKTIFNISPEAIVLTNEKGEIIDLNNRSEDWLGYAVEELKNKSVSEMPFLGEDAKKTVLNKFISRSRGEKIEPYELKFRARNGECRTGLILHSPIFDSSGSFRGELIVIPDITERIAAENKQQDLMRELENANAELKEFAYVVSHDLKAPLRAINALASWISSDYSESFDDDGKEQMALLISRVNRMHNLIDGILQYSRVGRIREEKQQIDLQKALPEIIDSLAPPQHITIKIETELPKVLFEPTRINQVFQNLLSNAIKFNDKETGYVGIGCRDEADRWEFYVRDNGPGIPPQHHQEIFKIFQTLQSKDEYESTGIGLTSVKKIITLYGGHIWVESAEGDGTTFRFTIKKEQ